MLLFPDTKLTRRIASLGAIFVAALLVRFALGFAKPDLSAAQGAVAGMTTMVFCAPTAYGLFHEAPLIPAARRMSYHVLSACVAMAFLVFVCLG